MSSLLVLSYLILEVVTLHVNNIYSPYATPRRPRFGVEVYLYSFFNFGASRGLVVKTTPQLLYPRERDTLPIV